MASHLDKGSHWDQRYLGLCKFISQWSKDPSTKVGACIVNPLNNSIVSLGFNGLPRGVDDTPERLNNREEKYPRIVHGEINAILFAGSTQGMHLYTYPFMPCARCAAIIIQAGIDTVIAPYTPLDLEERWQRELAMTEEMFEESRVSLYLVDFK